LLTLARPRCAAEFDGNLRRFCKSCAHAQFRSDFPLF